MGLNTNKHETLMYQSRLLLKHINVETASDRSLLFTIYTNKVFDYEHFKRAVYQKPHRVLYGAISAPNNFTYSMMIAGDVECSKTGTVSLEILKTPYEPHYHGVMVFSKSDWCRIEPNLSEVIGRIKSALYDIREVKKPLIDDDGVCTRDMIWIEKFKESTKPRHKFSSSFSNYINYIFKTDYHAQKHGIQSYVPSVFPHDLYPPKDKSSSAEPLFKQLCLVEEAFQQKRKKNMN
ncbi:hypothetical protein OAN23_07330 [Amylibacter sp.]|nr:hypothetical protein [Amylibacter sp.]